MTEARDELIEMGNCTSCNKPWYMTVGEKSFFQSLIDKKAAEGGKFSMPTHCKDCRDIKKNRRIITPESAISKVEHMAREAEKGHYIMDDEELANDLKDVARMLRTLFGSKLRRENDKNQESVGQHTEGGSVSS